MTAHLGAHEVLEIHEILTDAINGINQFELYRPHVNDHDLRQILDSHLMFMVNEYNHMVQALNHRGMNPGRSYRATQNYSPVYGLDNPTRQMPNMSINQMDDRDVASGMLGCYKSSAVFKTMAALECADPGMRRMLQQGIINCSEMAYEVWQYMNHRGYYQVPTMKEMTTNTVLNSYEEAPVGRHDHMNHHTNNQFGARHYM
jgi:spore coat protein CotF